MVHTHCTCTCSYKNVNADTLDNIIYPTGQKYEPKLETLIPNHIIIYMYMYNSQA